MEKNGLYPLTTSLEFMLKVIFTSSLTDHPLKNMFDVTVFSNLEASGDHGHSRLFLLERFTGGQMA